MRQYFVLKICNPLEDYQMKPINPYWSPRWKPTTINALCMYGDLKKTKHSLPSELQGQKLKQSDSYPTWNIYLPNFVTCKIPSDLHHSPYHGLLHLVFNYIIQKGIRCNRDNLSFRTTAIYSFRHSSFQCHYVLQYVYNTNRHISKTNRKSLKT
jgi:hypothetical protein